MLDVAVTTEAVSERTTVEAQVDEVRAIAGREIGTVTADAGFVPMPIRSYACMFVISVNPCSYGRRTGAVRR